MLKGNKKSAYWSSLDLFARRTDLQVAGLIAVAAVLYWPTTSALWHRPVFGGNAALVAALAMWLIVRVRDRIVMTPVIGSPRVSLLLVPCSICVLLFWRSGIVELQLVLLPALILLAVWTAFGSAVSRLIAVPVCFLYFAVPAWDLLGPPLQSLTLWAVKWLAPTIGVPATVSGTNVLLPGNIRFEVSLACSGSGFLMEGLAVAVLLGELEHATIRRRLALMGSMLIIAVIANWVRVLALIQIGYSTGMRHVLVMRHHLMFGYVLFVLVLVAFAWVTRRTAPASAPPVVGTVALPAPASGGYLTALIALAAAPLLVAVLALLHEGEASGRPMLLPSGHRNWGGPLATDDPTWRPLFVGPPVEWSGTYHNLMATALKSWRSDT